ncbi:hypothetical protein GCM10010103_77900 [Streptomyces paradoxus]
MRRIVGVRTGPRTVDGTGSSDTALHKGGDLAALGKKTPGSDTLMLGYKLTTKTVSYVASWALTGHGEQRLGVDHPGQSVESRPPTVTAVAGASAGLRDAGPP